MILSLIVAVSLNHAIGFENKLIYWLPNDLKRFKTLTTGHTIVMGRKTFESLPKGALPNRRNIVISHQKDLSLEGAEVYSSLEEAFQHCGAEEEVFIIGGESIYRQTIDKADQIYLTLVENVVENADAFFPEINLNEWIEKGRESFPKDEKHLYPYTFIDYKRKSN